MIRFKHWLAVWFFLGAWMIQLHGQALPGLVEGNGNRPVFGIHDPSDRFKGNPDALKRISDRIRKLEAEHGYLVCVLVEPVLLGTTASEKAGELRQAWVPDGNGLVVVFEADSRSLGIGRDLAAGPHTSENRSLVPSYETASIINRAMTATDPKLSTDAFLETLVTGLVTGFEDYFKRRDTPPPADRSVKLGLLVVGTLALLGLGGIAVGGFVRHSSMAAIRRFRFPVVDRPERLGAPCGGSVTARRFRQAR